MAAMSAPKDRPIVSPVPRVAVTRAEAAASLGISLTTFDQLVAPDVKMIRHGRLRLVPVVELERWAAERSERTLT
jgi:hypothetical protein